MTRSRPHSSHGHAGVAVVDRSRLQCRFGLRTMLAVLSTFSLIAASIAQWRNDRLERRRIVDAIVESGGKVTFHPPSSWWQTNGIVRTLIGDEILSQPAEVHTIGLEWPKSTIKGLALLTTVKELRLEMSGIDDLDLTQLRDLKMLETVHLCGCAVSGSGFANWRSRRSLRYLALSEGDLNEVGLASIAEMTELRDLLLPNMALSDDDAWCFDRLAQLELICVDGNCLTEVGLARIVAGKPKLRCVYCCDNVISDRILDSAGNLRQLQHLLLTDNRISDEGLGELRTRLPNTRIP